MTVECLGFSLLSLFWYNDMIYSKNCLKIDLDMALDIKVYLMCNKFGLQCFCFSKQGPKFCYRIDFWSMTTIQIILSFCTLTSSQFCWFKVGNVLSFYNHDYILRLYMKNDWILVVDMLHSVLLSAEGFFIIWVTIITKYAFEFCEYTFGQV